MRLRILGNHQRNLQLIKPFTCRWQTNETASNCKLKFELEAVESVPRMSHKKSKFLGSGKLCRQYQIPFILSRLVIHDHQKLSILYKLVRSH